ncbi:MAG: aminotransferase class V-fold PLP-dependent enzyme, partial [Candidatus Hermodarchaeota archaeon]|nr:aminotransferase class V-fold PLP-dependent enzyme [Candidatus Hermodarchaeota archaeon]
DDNVWINASSIGAMPRVALKAAENAIRLNVAPYRLPETIFTDVPKNLKSVLGKLIGARPENIILGNSASYGIHLWANGLPLKKGDEVLLAKGDFPASILPWLYLRKHGVKVHEIAPKGPVLQVDDIKDTMTSKTKVLAPTWVDSFTGYQLDAKAIGQLCQDHDILFLLNLTQGLGGEPFNVSKIPIDGITCTGYKWLCGPYATGFCWMKPDLIDVLEYNQAYWIPHQGDRELDKIREYQILANLGAAQYDVFGKANLFNFLPWIECIHYFLDKGLDHIKQHNLALVDQFLRGLDSTKYTVHSPQAKKERTAIILISHLEPERNKAIYKLLQEEHIFISFREGLLRFSPHLYNNSADIDKTLTILNSFC